jgi:multidrug efflux pump subunit AcrB
MSNDGQFKSEKFYSQSPSIVHSGGEEYSPSPVAYRVSGPDPDKLRDIANTVQQAMKTSSMMRTVNADWGMRTPTLQFTLQQDRLQALGVTSSAVAQQLQFLLSGIPLTSVREDIRTVQVVARSEGAIRLDPAKIGGFTLTGANGQGISLLQVGKVEVRMEEPIMPRRDRMPTISVWVILPRTYNHRMYRPQSSRSFNLSLKSCRAAIRTFSQRIFAIDK